MPIKMATDIIIIIMGKATICSRDIMSPAHALQNSVYNIIKGIDQHSDYGRQGELSEQAADIALLR